MENMNDNPGNRSGFDKLRCSTKYPIILIHGTGFRDGSRLYDYWGRIPKFLSDNGAMVFFSGHDAWSSIEKSAGDIKPAVIEVISLTGAKKVNLIAHSKGGLDARHMISNLKMDKYIASLTTISTPHHGSVTIDRLCKLPSILFRTAAFFVNIFFKILGYEKPDFYLTCTEFSTASCAEFNTQNPDMPGVYYQSYAAKMRNPFSDLLFFITYPLIKLIEGDNDGLCTVHSAQWGVFKGTLSGKKTRGVSHADMVDFRKTTAKSFDTIGTYLKIAEELKDMGL
jgi:triacylglycerol lipase